MSYSTSFFYYILFYLTCHLFMVQRSQKLNFLINSLKYIFIYFLLNVSTVFRTNLLCLSILHFSLTCRPLMLLIRNISHLQPSQKNFVMHFISPYCTVLCWSPWRWDVQFGSCRVKPWTPS